MSIDKRIATLESADRIRVNRAIDQALAALTPDELDLFGSYHSRSLGRGDVWPTPDEAPAVVRYIVLVNQFCDGITTNES
jgi:hypothetical protein